MGKTIRRKTQSRKGWYDHVNEVRNRSNAADAYFHGDMPNRDGRGAGIYKGVKDDANQIRRREVRELKEHIDKNGASEVESFNDDKLAKAKSNECWQWS